MNVLDKAREVNFEADPQGLSFFTLDFFHFSAHPNISISPLGIIQPYLNLFLSVSQKNQ